MGALPNLLIVGVAKCGTTALHSFIDQHPAAQMSRPKELNYFAADADLEGIDPGLRSLLPKIRNWERRDLDWYRSHFNPAAEVRGESSVAYASPWHSAAAAERAAAAIPEARIIFLARDPIARVRSEWADNRAKGIESRPFEDAVGDPDGLYIQRSRYANLLSPWLERFPREQIHCLRTEELRGEPAAAMAEIHSFLGLAPAPGSYERTLNSSATKGRRASLLARVLRVKGGRALRRLPAPAAERLEQATTSTPDHLPTVTPAIAQRLHDLLADETARFGELSGLDTSGWLQISRSASSSQ